MSEQIINARITADTKQAEQNIRKIKRDFKELGDGARELISPMNMLKTSLASLSVWSGIQGVQSILDAALAMERLNTQFKVVMNSSVLGAAEMRFVREEAKRLGQELVVMASAYNRLLQATKGTKFEGAPTKAMFSGFSDAFTALKMTSDQMSGVWLQINQGMMKGKIQLEDINVISERGLNIIKLLEISTGKTSKELFDMIGKSKLTADEYMKLGPLLTQMYGGAAKSAAQELQGSINNFKTSFMDLKASIGAEFTPAFSSMLKTITANMNDIAIAVKNIGIAMAAVFAGRILSQLAEKSSILKNLPSTTWSRVTSGGETSARVENANINSSRAAALVAAKKEELEYRQAVLATAQTEVASASARMQSTASILVKNNANVAAIAQERSILAMDKAKLISNLEVLNTAKQMENSASMQAKILRDEEVLKTRLIGVNARLGASEAQYQLAQLATTNANAQHNASMAQSIESSKTLSDAKRQESIASSGLSLASQREAAMIDAARLAKVNASGSARLFAAATTAAAGAARAAGIAFNAMGGWIGILVIALTTAVMWWNNYKNAKEKAVKASTTADPYIDKLKEEIKQMQHTIALNTGNLKVIDAIAKSEKELELQRMNARKQELKTGIQTWEKSNPVYQDTPIIAAQRVELAKLEKEIKSVDELLIEHGKLKKQVQSTMPKPIIADVGKPDKVKIPKEKDLTSLQNSLADAQLRTEEALTNERQANAKGELEKQLAALDILKEKKIMTELQVLERRTQLEKEFSDKNIASLKDQANAAFDNAVKRAGAASVSGLDEENKLKTQIELEQAIGDEIKKRGEVNAAVTAASIASGKTEVDILQARNKETEAAVKAAEELAKAQKIAYDKTPIGGMTNAIKAYGDEAANVGKQLESSFSQFFWKLEDAITDSIMKMKLDFKSLFQFIQAEIIKLSIAKPITNAIAGAVGAMLPSFAGAATLQAAGLSTAIPSALAPAAEFTLAPTVGPTIAAATQSGAAAGVASGFASALPYIGIAVGAAIVANEYFGKGGMWNQSTDSQKVTRGWTSLNPMTWGATLADWATGGGLFGTKWKQSAGGVSVGIENGEIGGQSYADFKKKKSGFRGNAYKTEYGELNDQWGEMLGREFEGVKDSIRTKSAALGISISEEALAGFNSAATKVNLAGLDAEGQQKALADYFRKISNEAILLLVPDIESMTRLGEDATAAYERMNALKLTNNGLLMKELELLGKEDSAGYRELLNTKRQAELLAMDKSTQEIQKRIWALEDEEKATARLAAVTAFNADITARMLSINGQDKLAGLLSLQVKQEKELADARKDGMDTTALAQVQQLEMAAAMKSASETVSEAVAKVLEASKKALTDAISLAQTNLQAMKSILSTSSSATYGQARSQLIGADATNVAERANTFIEASKSGSATLVDYQRDVALALNKLGALTETAPTLSFVEQQIVLLERIEKAVTEGDKAMAKSLEITYNAAQIDMGTAKNSLTIALEGIQSVLNTPITDGTSKVAIQLEIDKLQAKLNTGVTGTAKDAITSSIGLLQLALNGTVSPAVATTGIQTTYDTVQGALNGTIKGGVAATSIAGQAQTVQNALNGTISGGVAATSIAGQASIIQGTLNGSISGATAKTKLEAQFGLVNTSLDSGLNTGTNSVSSLIGKFNGGITEAAKTTQKGLTDFVNALAVVSNYTRQRTEAQSAIGSLSEQYRAGTITSDQYTVRAAAAVAPLNATIAAGQSYGLTSLSAPSTALSNADIDARMRLQAQSVMPSDRLAAVQKIQSGLSATPRETAIATTNENLWGPTGRLATGAVLWSSVGLPAFAAGGITSGISIAGEAGPEAVVPLPDGRTIPVRMTGRADNAELVNELRALRKEVADLRSEQRSGHVAIAQNTSETARKLNRWDGDGMPPERIVA